MVILMKLADFFHRIMPEDPLRKVANVRDMRRVHNILEDIEGVGCRVEKPTNREGLGWRIIVDGSSDVDIGEYKLDAYPFEIIATQSTPGVWDQAQVRGGTVTMHMQDASTFTCNAIWGTSINSLSEAIPLTEGVVYLDVKTDSEGGRKVTVTKGDLPADNSNHIYIKIGYILANGAIVQTWKGGDISFFDHAPDETSIERRLPDGKIQLGNWDENQEALNTSDGFVIRRGTTSKSIHYITFASVASAVDTAIRDNIITDAVADAETDHPNWAHRDIIQSLLRGVVQEIVIHEDLADMPDTDGSNDDHDKRYWHGFDEGGQDEKNFDTSGYCKANELRVIDAVSGYQKWTSQDFICNLDSGVGTLGKFEVQSSATATVLSQSVKFGALYGSIGDPENCSIGYEGFKFTDISMNAVGDITIDTAGQIALQTSADKIILEAGAGSDIEVLGDGEINLINEANSLLGCLRVQGVKVVGIQGDAIADVTVSGADEDSVARTAINYILAAMRTHGLIAT